MSKGSQLPHVNMKKTKISEFDEFFKSASDPLSQLVDTNNELDEKVKELRSIGQELKKTSTKDPPPVLGQLIAGVKDGVVGVAIEKDGKVVPSKSLDKVGKTYMGNVETKAKLLTKRLKDIQKLSGLENATFKVGGKRSYQLALAGDEEALKKHSKDDAMDDMNRSLCKFNDRADILSIHLNGPVSLGEAVSAIINAIKEDIEAKKKEFKIALKNGKPKIEGIPDNVEDFFPELIARGWELLKSTFEFLEGQKEAMPQLQEKINKLGEETKDLPGKLKNAASNANLSASELLKAGKATSANAKVISTAPKTIVQLGNTLQETSLQLTSGITGRMEASKAGESGTHAVDESSGEGE